MLILDAVGPGAQRRATAPLAWLHFRSRDAARPAIAVHGSTALIGAAPENDIVVTDAGLAARHGQFRLRGGVWTFNNLHPVAPMWIDGEPAPDEVVLAPGSIVCLGDAALAFEPVDQWDDSPMRSANEVRPPLMVLPSASRSPWPTVIFVVALCVVIGAVIVLARSH